MIKIMVPNKKQQGFTLVELMIVIAIIAILAAIMVPNFIRARANSQKSACESNLKNFSTALEMYAVDNDGHYPPSNLSTLKPKYLKELPECPAAGFSTYSYESVSRPSSPEDGYTVFCKGDYHKAAGLQMNYPLIGSHEGRVIEEP